MYTGLYLVHITFNQNAFTHDRPSTIENNNVNISFLSWYSLLVMHKQTLKSHSTIVDNMENREIHYKLDSGWCYQKLIYFIQSQCYMHIPTTREPLEHLEQGYNLDDWYHWEHSNGPIDVEA
jgi:hypothetical protein